MNPLKDTSAAWTVVFVSSLISSVSCNEYNDQSSWEGICQTGRKQSPIDMKFSQAEGKNEFAQCTVIQNSFKTG